MLREHSLPAKKRGKIGPKNLPLFVRIIGYFATSHTRDPPLPSSDHISVLPPLLQMCVNFTVCEQPALVCHGPQLPCVCWVVFASRPSHRRCILASLMRQRPGHNRMHETTFDLHEIFKCAYLNLRYMAASIRTTSANAVTLVWGSLRLAPIIPRVLFTQVPE